MAGTLTISTLSDGTNSTSATNCIKGSAKAWVIFNSSGTILNSYNISSITVNGSGDYVLNFTTAMPSSSYAVSGTSSDVPTFGRMVNIHASTAPTTTAVRVAIFSRAGTLTSGDYNCFSING